MCPAQRAMAGVQEQIIVFLGAANHRHIGRRHRAQAGPEHGVAVVGPAGEQLLGAVDQRGAAHGVQLGGIAIELSGAGNAQAVAQPGEHQPVFFVGDADHRRVVAFDKFAVLHFDFGFFNRHGGGIALGRVNRQIDADGARQQRRITAHGHHKGVGGQRFVLAIRAGDGHAAQVAATGEQGIDAGVVAEFHAFGFAQQGQALGEHACVAGFIAGAVGAAGQLGGDVAQGRFDFHNLVAGNHLAVHAVGLHQQTGVGRFVQRLLALVDGQDATGLFVVVDAGFGAQVLQRAPAVQPQIEQLADILLGAARAAFGEEFQRPRPLPAVKAPAKQQRGVFFGHPFQRAHRRAGVGPRLGLADRNLAAIGIAGFDAGLRLAINHDDFMTGLGQEPGSGNSDNAGAQHHDFHRVFSFLCQRGWRDCGP